MQPARGSSLSIDLTRVHRRSVTSLFSNLVTRPTGRAIRTGVESQIAEIEDGRAACLSILDFSQVRVLDYSCADEIVAKLLLRFSGDDRPAEAFFVVRGIQEHHEDAIEAVLERHGLLLVAQDEAGEVKLLGTANPLDREAWEALRRRGRANAAEVAADAGLAPEAADAALAGFCTQRVATRHADGSVSALTQLLEG